MTELKPDIEMTPTLRAELVKEMITTIMLCDQSKPEAVAQAYITLKEIERAVESAVKGLGEVARQYLDDGELPEFGGRYLMLEEASRTTVDGKALLKEHPEFADAIKFHTKVTAFKKLVVQVREQVPA